ncbi:hypothetical protein CU669_05455 [Paramagnetospirillum kuznetsovii]|uniref:Filamentous haemagglutinin FhaB/tRNA nuclease CdiA-like TPS domain-containing protein n=1 Tax=Paramagnetospirillum kuznetsovii TaxID=2053833 RepID=A0A364P139_9PROT|nr:filamentous hemagglutinin N-terminal domain-containing protein [Paramagnetospirillum kuznetsovii]RAU22835.1 hypothetical protein CU669_05455 [Paramagnetospirillum kuznetsovii]
MNALLVFGRRPLLLSSTILAMVPALVAEAAPQNGSVVSGQATITQSGNTLNIIQQSSKLVINWNSFSIGAGEIVRITQPNAQASILNRVIGGSMSSLNGQLLANGIVFIVNPNGIQIGSSGRISVGSFVATTSSIANADFLAARYAFSAPTANGAVSNAGVISAAPTGTVILAAVQVENSGQISAPQGAAALGAAKTFNVDVNGDGLLRYQVGEAAVGAVATNSGLIKVAGGQVLIAARSIDAVTRDVINVGGLVEANSVSAKNGEIVFDGGATGIVSVTGQVQAVGANSGETGGTVKVLGQTVGIMDGARIDASGATGGGTILAGGNWHGEGPESNSSVTYLAPTATLVADATDRGNGGQVVVWSDGTTRAYGFVSVRGGAGGGDGGAVEVSGKSYLAFEGSVDRTASSGRSGSLLLDPLDFDITHGAAGGSPVNMAGNPLTPNVGGPASSITDGKIVALLGGGAVSLSTSAGGNITMMNTVAINTGATNSLTINSGGNFTGQNGSSITTGGAVSISAGNASVLNYSTATTAGGNISLSGGDVSLGGGGAPTINSTGGNISVTATRTVINNGAVLTAGAGTVTLNNPAGGGSPPGASRPPPPPPPPPPGSVAPGPQGMGAPPPGGVGAGDVLGGAGPGGGAPGQGPGGGDALAGEASESAFGPPGEPGAQGAEQGGRPGGPPQPGGGRDGPRKEPAAKPAVAQVIPGLLQREVPAAPAGNQDIPGVSQRYSSFGNPALW